MIQLSGKKQVSAAPLLSGPLMLKGIALAAAIALIYVFPAVCLGAEVEMELSADKTEITVGDLVQYSITLTWDPKAQPTDPLLEENLGDLVIRDRKPGQPTDLPDGRKRRTDVYIITSYTVGEYKVPPPLVKYKSDSGEDKVAAGEPVALKVRSVAPEDAKEIRDIKPPRSVPRDLTRPLLYAAAVLAGLALIITGIILLVRRLRRKSEIVEVEDPYARAMRRLSDLWNMPRANHEEMKAFYVELSDILRGHLNSRFRIPAPLLTTTQLRRYLEDNSVEAALPETAFLGSLLTGDYVKFAKFDPSEETVMQDFKTIQHFLMITGLVEEPAEKAPKQDSDEPDKTPPPDPEPTTKEGDAA
jgi:hypothetical protein